MLLDACRIVPALTPADPATDWPTLLDAAERHAVTPLLARWCAARPEGIPLDVLATLRAHYDANSLRNLALTQRLVELLALLSSHGVDAMPLKGPALAISAYGDLALRVFADLDIVVRPADFDHARELLGHSGYRPLAQLSSAGERALRSSDHHLPLVHEASSVKVELHWSLDNVRPGRFLDGEWVWANARTVSLLGRELPALSWSALLLYLCVHGAKHGFTRLGWVRDIAGVLMAAPAGELASVADLAASTDARRRLALGVALASELLDAPERDDLRTPDIPEVAALVREARERLFGVDEPTRLQWIAFQCSTFDTMRDRAGYWWHVLAAPHVSDVESMALPGWLAGAYYLLRPARLAAKRVRGLLGPQS